MALALKKYTLIPTTEGTLDPRYPDGNQAPIAPVLGTVNVISPIQLDIPLATPSTGGVAPLTYILERSETSASAGFSVIHFNAFSPVEDTFEDTNLASFAHYWYRCYAIDSNTVVRQSDYSNVVDGITEQESGDVTPPSVPLGPDQPGGFASPSHTSTTITLTWPASTDS